MFDGNVFIKGTCHNIEENGEIIGYELKTHITYYRGIPLSMINYIKVEEDGVEVPEEAIRFTPDDIDYFTLSEMETVSEIKWEYGTPGIVRVLKKGGLTKGKHMIRLRVCTRTAYIPVPLEGSMTREVEIA